MENGFFQNVTVKLGYTVYRMRTDNREICHAYLIVCNNGHTGNPIPISGIQIPKIRCKSTVDFANYGVNPRQFDLEQIFSPTLEF